MVDRAQSGRAWHPPKAEDWNAIAESAEDYQRRRLRGYGNGPQRIDRSLDTVLVRNDTGSDLLAGDLLALDDVVITAASLAVGTAPDKTFNQHEFFPNLIWKGTAPNISSDPKHIGNFCILLEAIKSTQIGVAAVSGICPARISNAHSDQPFADVANGSTTLTSNWYGAAQILYREQLTDVTDDPWWAIVRLGNFQAPIYKANTTEAIAVDSNGTCNIWMKGAVTSPVSTVEVYLDWMDGGEGISSGIEIFTRFFRDQMKWIALGAECEP